MLERLYPDFPSEEYQRRLENAQREMKRANVDVLLLTEKENVEYFSGYINGHWGVKGFPPGVVLIPQSGAPILLTPDFLSGTAERTSWIRDIRRHTKTHVYPENFVSLLEDALKGLGAEQGRIGIESGPELMVHLPVAFLDAIRARFNKAQFVSGAVPIWETRKYKSPLEIERVKKAAQLADKALQALKDAMTVGTTEIEMARIAKIAMLEGGADTYSFINFRAGPERYHMSDTLPQERPLRNGDGVIIDFGAMFKGYVSDMCRTAFVGGASPEQERYYNIALRAQKAGIQALRPGAKVKDVYQTVAEIMKETEIDEPLGMCGHNLGLEIHEPPILTYEEDTVLKPGMIMTVEPWIRDPDNVGMIAVEDIVLITEDKPDVLTSFPKEDMWIVK